MEDVKKQVREFFERFFRPRDDDEDIIASGYVNSLFMMQLVVFVENDLGVPVEDADLDLANFRSVNAIGDFVARKRSADVERAIP